MNIITDKNEIFRRLGNLASRRVLILGVGNSLKADDGVGPYICSKISSKVSAKVINVGVALENFTGPVTSYNPEVMLFLDVIDLGKEPGTLCLIPLDQAQSFALSTHSLSPHLFSNIVSRNSQKCGYIVGIQPKHLTLGEPMSDEVVRRADILAEKLIEIFSDQGSIKEQ